VKHEVLPKPPTPTRTLSASVGPVTVRMALYGRVSGARLAQAKRDVQFRAEQLAPRPPRVERDDDYDAWSASRDMSNPRPYGRRRV
jgi:hypothetical protein